MSQLSLGSHAFALARSADEVIHSTDAAVVGPRHYRIGVVPVSFFADSPRLRQAFDRYYQPYRVRVASRGAFEVAVVRRRSWRSLRSYYHVLLNGQPQCALRRESSVLPHVEWALNAAVARYLPDYYQIHAAAVARHGAGVILAGSPGAGKSTLTAGLIARGWSYLSDEFALIDPRVRRLLAYPKALCIKAGSFDTLRQLGLPVDEHGVLHKGSKGPVTLIDPLDIRADAVSSPCEVRAIVLPAYQAGVRPYLEPMSAARAVYELVQYSFNFTKFRGEGLALLGAVARGAQCYRLTAGDLGETCDLLDCMFENLSAQHAECGAAIG